MHALPSSSCMFPYSCASPEYFPQRWRTADRCPAHVCAPAAAAVFQDKDALRKEAAAKLKEAKAAMMALTESQLDTVSPCHQRGRAAFCAHCLHAPKEEALVLVLTCLQPLLGANAGLEGVRGKLSEFTGVVATPAADRAPSGASCSMPPFEGAPLLRSTRSPITEFDRKCVLAPGPCSALPLLSVRGVVLRRRPARRLRRTRPWRRSCATRPSARRSCCSRASGWPPTTPRSSATSTSPTRCAPAAPATWHRAPCTSHHGLQSCSKPKLPPSPAWPAHGGSRAT